MKGKFVRYIAVNGVIAAVYAALTLATPWASFGPVQFRAAELLNMLAFFDAGLVPGVGVGCFVANLLMSPYGFLDAALGTAATLAALWLIARTRNFYAATIWPAVTNAVIIPFVIIYFEQIPLTGYNFFPIAGGVAAGELAVCAVVGSVIYRLVLRDAGSGVRRALARLRR